MSRGLLGLRYIFDNPTVPILQIAPPNSLTAIARLGHKVSALPVELAAAIVFVAFVLQYNASIGYLTNRTLVDALSFSAKVGDWYLLRYLISRAG